MPLDVMIELVGIRRVDRGGAIHVLVLVHGWPSWRVYNTRGRSAHFLWINSANLVSITR